MGGDLAPSLGDATKFSRTFPEKFPFSRPKILMTFFSSDFDSLLRFSVSYCIKCHIWPFLHNKKPSFNKKFLDDTYFLLCSSFRAHPTTLLLKIVGGPMHGPSPPQILGDRPPSPPYFSAPANYDSEEAGCNEDKEEKMRLGDGNIYIRSHIYMGQQCIHL